MEMYGIYVTYESYRMQVTIKYHEIKRPNGVLHMYVIVFRISEDGSFLSSFNSFFNYM